MPLRVASGKQGVLWNGAFFQNHSLALVNRELTLALMETGQFELGIQHYEQAAFGPDADPRFRALAARMKALPEDPSVTVRHLWPPDFRRPETKRFVLIQPWEFGSLPNAWVENIAATVDECWVPSTFVRDEYLGSGVPAEKVVVVPNGVNTARFHPGVEPLSLPTSKRFKFLFVGGTIARKGIDVLLDAYTRAFTAKDDVALVIKDFGTNSFYAGQNAQQLISALQAKPGAPEIVYLNQDMTEAEIASLYAGCDCLVHPYRGEGYGLPIAEAMACAKPAILTNFGAALDFANERNSYLVRATPVRLDQKRIGDMETVDYPYWAEPDREALIAALKYVVANPAEASEKGRQAAQDIAAKHTWAHAAKVAAERLEALHRGEPRRVTARPAPLSTYEDRKQEALALTRAADWAGAVAKIEACLAGSKEDWDLLNALGVALFRTGQKERARELMRQGIDRAPDARDFHHNLAFLLLDDGTSPVEALEHAIAAYEQSADPSTVRRTLERARSAVLRETRRARRKSYSKSAAKESARALTTLVAKADSLLATESKSAIRNPQSAIPKPRLSLVMIVKNEEKYLDGCLESVRGAVDEMVVVDTGSTDSTREIARKYGATVIDHVWTDDFSAARNVSLQHVTGDWALWLDADERLAEGHAALLRILINDAQPNVGGYMVNIRNIMRTDSADEVCWHRACRLFRLTPTVRFTGRVHEQNLRPLQEAGYVCAMSQLNLDHYGYAADVMAERNKHQRFIRMLHREVEENLDDAYRPFHLFNLANAYYTLGDMQNAVLWFEKAGEVADPVEEYTSMLFAEWATALYMIGRAQESLSVCDRAEKIGIQHPGIEFARGHACLHLERYEAAERHFQKAIADGKSGLFVHTGDSGAYNYKAKYGLGLAALGQEKYDEAAEWCRHTLAEKNDFLDARYVLANALFRSRRLPEARREYETLLAATPDNEMAQLDLTVVLHELGDYAAALTSLRRMAARQPNTLEVWTRLADCCERLALYDEARDAYLTAKQLAPRSPEIRVNLGRTYAALGDDSKAIDSFTDAIFLAPDHANAYFNAADVLYRLGLHAKAAETLHAGLQRDPENAGGLFVLGNCYFQTRDYAAASLAYKEALARKPDYAEARSNLELAEQSLAETAA